MAKLFRTTFFLALLFLSTVAAQCHQCTLPAHAPGSLRCADESARDCRVDFPDVVEGSAAFATVTLVNSSHDEAALIQSESAVEDLEGLPHSAGTDPDRLVPIGIGSPFHYKGGQYPGEGGTCSSRLEPLQQCTLVFEVTPNVKGFYSQEVPLQFSFGPDFYVREGRMATLFVEAKAIVEEE